MTERASDDVSTPAATLARILIGLAENMAPLYEAVDQYRRRAIDEGWGAEAAARIAADYHRYVIELLLYQHLGAAGRPPTPPDPESIVDEGPDPHEEP